MSLTGRVLGIHESIYKRTDGRVGHRMIGVPTLLLRTTGRRSGAIRTNGLVYARDGGDYLVVASDGGADRHPALIKTRSSRAGSARSRLRPAPPAARPGRCRR